MTHCVVRKGEPTDRQVEFWLEQGENGTVNVCCSGGWHVVAFKPTADGIRLHRYKTLGHGEFATVESQMIALTA